MNTLRMGIDVGSTTAKVVVINGTQEIVFSAYQRHHAATLSTLQQILKEAQHNLGDIAFNLLVTGSAGMGIAESYQLPFIQEVIASAEVVRQFYPQVRTLIDIGGEDAKMIFFDDEGRPDIRMNGSCAGGTGAFIDEMATLLNIPVTNLNALAQRYTTIYPMASRCGVFAKTDLQNLLSRDIAREDIAASVFHAVVLQSLATLSRGYEPMPKVLFSGGPLTFLPSLQQAFMRVLEIAEGDVIQIENAQLLPALGASIAGVNNARTFTLQTLLDRLRAHGEVDGASKQRLQPLFTSQETFQAWETTRISRQIVRLDPDWLKAARPEEIEDGMFFLGVDSGSTTTKVVLIDELGRVVFDDYRNNNGNAIKAVQQGLQELRKRFKTANCTPRILRSVVTGYGEDLIRAAYGFDDGMVETLAHYEAARAFDEDVSFILDIGGQDMKAIFVKDGHIQNIAINEACSSGCGSFIENFARSMGHSVGDFAEVATTSAAPCDLGTRCTVFMNSRVKQALREHADISDISAGLAYSVIKNALYKVLKVTDVAMLGEHIVVQGGTFRNPAVHKALEQLLGRSVTCPDMAELMGAYGAALRAKENYFNDGELGSTFVGLENLEEVGNYVKKLIRCHGCENRCNVTKLEFPNDNVFYSGNRCERIYSNSGKAERTGENLPALKLKMVFERDHEPETEPLLTIGIPRVLNMFENFPFWNTLFVESGIRVQLSDPSSNDIYQKGAAAIMSENLCFPAKLVSGHIYDLIDKGVDRIFYPMVFFEENHFSDSANCFNCPIVSGYADVIRSVIDPSRRHHIPYDMPAVNFDDKGLFRKTCVDYLTGLGVKKKTVLRAFEKAITVQHQFKEDLRAEGARILAKAEAENRPVILLLGRPYHIDPLINHKIPDILTNFGLDVITEDSVPLAEDQTLDNKYVLTQWEYINRYYHACRWAGAQENVEVVQLNSFGCGPDPYILDEVRIMLGEYGKIPTVIRIDEIESAGSTKLRLRSMMESLKHHKNMSEKWVAPRVSTRVYQEEDRQRTIIVPDFSTFCSPAIARPFADLGFDVVTLPPADRESVEVGLKYTNNEICYPGIITIGDLIKALQSGKYDPSKTAVGYSQTGGQCRASSVPALLKKALVAAGYAEVPVITLSINLQTLNDQPGLNIGIRQLKDYLFKAAIGMMFTDSLSAMYYATAVREVHKGDALKLADHYLQIYQGGTVPIEQEALLELLSQAVADFNNVETNDQEFPKAGIVGEIYVKYNSFSNNEVAQWLMDQDIEVIVPPMMEFFAGSIVAVDHGIKSHVKRPGILWLVAIWGRGLLNSRLHNFNAVMKGFRNYRPHHDIREIARKAEELVTLNHQYGEGWLIAGEVATFLHEGVPNVLCLQPFGCIANHVVAKGVHKRIKERYPEVNMIFLDADAGVSEVNFFNRMHFFVDHARKAFAQESV